MKKRLISALALALALTMTLPFALSACDKGKTGGDETSSGDSGASGETTPQLGGEVVVVPNSFSGYVLTASADGIYDISDNLFGVFLEDINFAVDGGLYAELVLNRSFEYGSLAKEGNKQGWSTVKSGSIEWSVINGSADGTSLNANNPSYARIKNTGTEANGLYNTGYFNGISLKSGEEYKFSVYARAVDGYTGGMTVTVGSSSASCAEAKIDSLTNEWVKYELTLKPTSNVDSNARISVLIDNGTVDIDMVSLFPSDTYKGRENGLRRDLAEAIADLKPRFLRFPGGCVIEGETLELAYDWKDSIGDAMKFDIKHPDGTVTSTVGDVATRPLATDIWANLSIKDDYPYYMSYGIGFYEYFLLCEDLGCEPIPVLNCGLSCLGRPAQEGPEPGTPEFQRYVDDALDLVEFCMGDTDTEWGAVRAAMGHPEKFDLTYIGIGNEQFGEKYNRRYAKFREAFNKAKEDNPELYGGIKLIMANGLTSGSTDGWDVVAKDKTIADCLDEHYYNEPTWFLMNNQRYDFYDRSNPTVFIGEYAAKTNKAVAAIAEAAYMTGIERNGDVVELAAYAPLLAYNGHTQWAPNLIWYNGNKVWASTDYYVQKIYGQNMSDKIIPSTLENVDFKRGSGISGKVGLGTWSTTASFDNVKVVSNTTGEVLYSNDFTENSMSGFETVSGSFSVKDGVMLSTSSAYPANDITGDVVYFGDTSWTNYTLTMTARKTGGQEGFIIPIAVKDSKNFYHWNIGGWWNTASALEYVENNVKSGKLPGTDKPCKLETNRDYEIKIVVSDYKIQCYLDGELMVDFESESARGVYTVIGEDDNDIIVKLVNTTMGKVPFKIDLSAVTSYEGEAVVQYIEFDDPEADNTIDKTDVTIKEDKINVKSVFEYDLTRYAMAVIRIPKK